MNDKPMSNKTKEVRDFIEEIFPGTAKAIEENRCPLCQQPITEFRDELSAREYRISGMCQKCQDKAFAEPDHDT